MSQQLRHGCLTSNGGDLGQGARLLAETLRLSPSRRRPKVQPQTWAEKCPFQCKDGKDLGTHGLPREIAVQGGLARCDRRVRRVHGFLPGANNVVRARTSVLEGTLAGNVHILPS